MSFLSDAQGTDAPEISDDEKIPLYDARKIEKGLTPGLLARWGQHGVKGRSGQRIYLKVVKRGGTPVTTLADYRRFCDACTEDSRYAIE